MEERTDSKEVRLVSSQHSEETYDKNRHGAWEWPKEELFPGCDLDPDSGCRSVFQSGSTLGEADLFSWNFKKSFWKKNQILADGRNSRLCFLTCWILNWMRSFFPPHVLSSLKKFAKSAEHCTRLGYPRHHSYSEFWALSFIESRGPWTPISHWDSIMQNRVNIHPSAFDME